MKKWIFAVVALLSVFAMISCGGNDSSPSVWTVTYNQNGFGGQAVPGPVQVNNGDSVVLPTLTGAGFQGWGLTAAQSGEALAGGTSYGPITGNVTLYVWYTGNSGSGVVVTFDYDYDDKETFTVTLSAVNMSFDDDNQAFPSAANDTNLVRQGWLFSGWYTGKNGTGELYTKDDPFQRATSLYAKWIEDKLTEPDPSEGAELIYLDNGAYALYQFEVPAGKTLADYETVSFKIKVSSATKTIWNDGGIRQTRLMGVYVPGLNVTVESGARVLNLNNFNAAWIANAGPDGTNVNGTVAEANQWYTITHNIRGNGNAAHNNSGNEADSTKSGTVFFGVGVSCQNHATDPDKQFVQLIKDVWLNPTSSSGAAMVTGTRPEKKIPVFPNPAYEVADFVAYADPIVFAWRGEPTQYNIDNWQDVVPKLEGGDWDRGTPPALTSLQKVELGDFTYVNRGNTTNQKGWVSFEEAGRANDQSTGIPSSKVVFANFKEAWYLELETAEKPNGTLSLVWMGGLGGWNSFAATENSGAAKEGVSWIIDPENSDDPYIIRILLPKALLSYEAYYKENTEWAALAFSYWGSGAAANVDNLGISKASLLVETPAGEAEGISLGLTFSLSDPPAGGNLIDDVVLDSLGTTLTVSAVSGLTDYRWFVDGTPSSEATGTLALTVTTGGGKKDISLQAKRGGRWVSQSVSITLKN